MSLLEDPTLQEVLLFENQQLREEVSRLKIKLGQMAVELADTLAELNKVKESLKEKMI